MVQEGPDYEKPIGNYLLTVGRSLKTKFWYIGSVYIGSAYIGSAYIGSAYIGSAYIGSIVLHSGHLRNGTGEYIGK